MCVLGAGNRQLKAWALNGGGRFVVLDLSDNYASNWRLFFLLLASKLPVLTQNCLTCCYVSLLVKLYKTITLFVTIY